MNVMFTGSVWEKFRMIKQIGHTFNCWSMNEVGIFDVHEAIEGAVWVTTEVKFDIPR